MVLHYKTGVLDGVNVALDSFLGAIEPLGQLNRAATVAYQQLYQAQQPFQLGLVHGLGGCWFAIKGSSWFCEIQTFSKLVA